MNKQEQARELIKIILGDKFDDVTDLIKDEDNEVELLGHRASVRAMVNLEKELDMKRLKIGPY